MSFSAPPGFEMVHQEETGLGEPNDCELMLIRAPKGIDIRKLHGVKYSSKRVKQVEVQEAVGDLTTVYELTPFQGEILGDQLLIATDGNTKLGPSVSGMLSVTKSYTSNNQPSSTPVAFLQPSGPVAMPEGLRVRFQPFGAGEPVKMPKKRKKDKDKKKHHAKDLQNSSSDRKHSHKNKLGHPEDEELLLNNTTLDQKETHHKGVKKSKKRKSKHDSSSDIEDQPKKRRKKHGSAVEEICTEDTVFDNTVMNERLNDTLSSEADVFMSNGVMSPEHTPRKMALSSGYCTADATPNTSHIDLYGKGSSKKKKHKKDKRSKV